MQKVVPSERLRRELDDVLAGIGEERDPVEAVARLGARLILQQALEDEVTEFVGRARYERADGDGEVIYRNGFAAPSSVQTTSPRGRCAPSHSPASLQVPGDSTKYRRLSPQYRCQPVLTITMSPSRSRASRSRGPRR
jgi:hypothetical protein